jgi:hypothetical protein
MQVLLHFIFFRGLHYFFMCFKRRVLPAFSSHSTILFYPSIFPRNQLLRPFHAARSVCMNLDVIPGCWTCSERLASWQLTGKSIFLCADQTGTAPAHQTMTL